MRLTNELRVEFVMAVDKALPPLPVFDNEGFAQRVRVLMEATVPEEVKRLDKAFPGAVLMSVESFDLHKGPVRRLASGALRNAEYEYLRVSVIRFKSHNKSEQIEAELEEARAAFKVVLDAEHERFALLNRIREIVQACSSDTALKEVLPELAHLVPKPVERSTMALVACRANGLIADLVKAGVKLPEAA